MVLILMIAAGGAAGFVFVGVLIQWSLRKALPSRPAHTEIEAAPAPEPEPLLPPPELAPEPTSEILERPAEIAEPVAPVEPEPPATPPPPPVRQPVRIGLGLRKTRENFLARIPAAPAGRGKM